MRELLGRGAKVQAKDADGQTALHYAVACEFEEIVVMLVGAGADITIADNDGDSPLGMSCVAAEVACIVMKINTDRHTHMPTFLE